MAPILSFTAEEAWAGAASAARTTASSSTPGTSCCRRRTTRPRCSRAGARLREVRAEVQKQLEELRAGRRHRLVAAGRSGDRGADGADLRRCSRSSATTCASCSSPRRPRVRRPARRADECSVTPSAHAKCERCWHYRDDVGADPRAPGDLRALRGQPRRRGRGARACLSAQPAWARWLALTAVVVASTSSPSALGQRRLRAPASRARSRRSSTWCWCTTPGAAFSFLAGAGGWQRWFFIGVALSRSAVLIVLLRAQHAATGCSAVALALILGGALGNLVDRVRSATWSISSTSTRRGYHWPAFNVADSAITVGAALLIWDSLPPRRSRRRPGPRALARTRP